MNRDKYLIGVVLPLVIWGIAVALIVGVFLLPSQVAPPEEAKILTPTVQVVPATRFSASLTVSADGVVVPFREIQLASQVAGRIAFKSENCRAGRHVKKGEALFRIDDRDYQLAQKQLLNQQDQAEIDLEQVSLDIREAGDLLKLTNEDHVLQVKEYERLKGLRARNAITDADVERGQRGVIAAQNLIVQNTARLDAARKREYRLQSQKELLKTQMEKATLDLQRTIVTSPVEGVVVRELVETDSFAQRGATLVVIEDTQRAEIRANLRMDDLFWVLDGRQTESASEQDYTLPAHPVLVSFEILGTRPTKLTWQGRLDRFDGRGLDTATRTVPIRVVVDEPDTGKLGGIGTLVRGMFVDLTISVVTPPSMVLIPKRALTTGNQVYVVRPADGETTPKDASDAVITGVYSLVEDVIPLREVETDDGEFWVIDSATCDITDGDWIVTQRLFGMPVDDPVKSKVHIELPVQTNELDQGSNSGPHPIIARS